MKKLVPFSKKIIEQVIRSHQTPFHIYNEEAILLNAKNLINLFSWNKGFKEYFAVKALPNPYILKILKNIGFGVDCSSLAELVLAEKVGFSGNDIMFTSNNTAIEEYEKALSLGAIINLDDITHIEFISKKYDFPKTICFRYNPGKSRSGNSIIGKPEEAKYGLTRDQILTAYDRAKKLGSNNFGLHTMVASNELNPQYFVDTAEMLFNLVLEINKKLNIKIDFVNIGGGIGIPYRPEQKQVDIKYISDGIISLYKSIILKNNLSPIKIFMENGRVITGPYGYLVTKVIHKKNTYKKYIGLDATMANLMRPGMYGAYHHITVLGKENVKSTEIYDITGSLCENNDKFAIDRRLPPIEIGDIVIIHDTGAHGHAMGFNYNGKLRSSEILLRSNREILEIRRAETIDDLFITLDFNKLKNFK